MACPGCPDAVTQTLRDKVQRELDKLNAILAMSNIFSDSINAAAANAFAAIDDAVAAIPNPVGVGSFLDILGYVTCPLTPLALGLDGLSDLTDTDPNTQLKKLRALGEGEISAARRAYERTLNIDPHAAVVRQIRKYEQQLRNITFDAASFAEATLIAATVFVVCGQEEFNEGPFNAFAIASQGFSFTAGVPSTLDTNIALTVSRLAEGEAKFALLRDSLQ